MSMLLVEEIKTVEVPYNTWEIFHHHGPSFDEMPAAGPTAIKDREEAYLEKEIVHGQEFRDSMTGKCRVIGFPRKVLDVLRLPLGAFEGMNRHITQLLEENDRLSRKKFELENKLKEGYGEMERLLGMSWWNRILFVFRGRRLKL
jgi:hypothetical protein